MYGKLKRRRGVALFIVTLATVVILGAVTAVVLKVQGEKVATDHTVTNATLDEACKAGIDFGVERIWNQYVVGNGNTTGNLASYRVFLNNLVPNNEDTNQNGQRDTDERDLNGDGTFDINSPVALLGATNGLAVGPAQVTSVTLSRTDDVTGSTLTLTSQAQLGTATRTASQTIRISGAPFNGYEYAILAKNINCILCHAEMRSLALEYNNDSNLYGTFDRIKVATLESLLYRLGSADSKVAGTIYTRGNIYDQYGNTISASQIGSSSLRGYHFSNTDGKITQGSTGGMSEVSLSNAAVNGDGEPEQFANLYKNYPSDPDLMTDGELPETFPAPYPDDDGDRYVDDSEFNTVANALSGSVQGGVVYGVPEESLYAETALPASSNDAATDLGSSGRYDGNVVLVGTDSDPIQLNGDIAIDGDLVIKGKVKGWGQLFVKGNTYIVGDVTYQDAPGAFGQAADGTENGLAIITGGSVLMGDYLTIRGKSHTDDGSKYPNKSYSIRMREEHRDSSVTVDGDTQNLQYGYFDPGVVDANGIEETMVDASGNTVTRTGQQFSFTQSELMLFNIMEVEKAVEDPNYRPRFYGLRDSQPNNVFTYHKPPDEHSVRYDEGGGGVKLLPDYLLHMGYDLSVMDDAAYHYMNPDGNWISEDILRQIWWNDEQTRSSSGDPVKFDGLLYSNNAIFTIARSRVRHGSYTDGKMLIRGAIICPDLGVLAPGSDSSGNESFKLLYDSRVRRFWAPEDTTQVAFQRLVYAPVNGATG